LATDLVRDNATQLAGYQATLGELITETSTPGSTAGNAFNNNLDLTVTVGGQTKQGYGTACRQPDGTWQMIS
jgi:surface antigen